MVCKTADSIAACKAIFTDSFLTTPPSTSTNSVSCATKRNMSLSSDALSIVLVTRTSIKTLPLVTETVRSDTVTYSLYSRDMIQILALRARIPRT